MKTISLKLADSILKDIDDHLETFKFSTRTEFIREAIRDKLNTLEHQRFEQEVRTFFKNHKDKLHREIVDMNSDVFQELEQRFGRT